MEDSDGRQSETHAIEPRARPSPWSAVPRSDRHKPLAERVASRTLVDPDTGCHLWQGEVHPQGYGKLQVDGKRVSAHRLAYELTNGPIPDGLVIDHLCRVRHCVNPDHMEAVTSRENTLRGQGLAVVQAARTHCPHGHPYSGNNLIVRRGRRFCRECTRVANRAQRAQPPSLPRSC